MCNILIIWNILSVNNSIIYVERFFRSAKCVFPPFYISQKAKNSRLNMRARIAFDRRSLTLLVSTAVSKVSRWAAGDGGNRHLKQVRFSHLHSGKGLWVVGWNYAGIFSYVNMTYSAHTAMDGFRILQFYSRSLVSLCNSLSYKRSRSLTLCYAYKYPASRDTKAPIWTTIIALSFHIKPTANHKNIPIKNMYILYGTKFNPVIA